MKEVLIGIFLCILGFFCLWAALKMLKLKRKLRGWKKIKATVLSKTVEERKILSGTDLNNFRISVEYQYEVDGKFYTNNIFYAEEIENAEVSMLKRMAQKKIDTLQQEIIVFYNPNNPQESYTIHKNLLFAYLLLLFGAIMILSVVIILL